MSWSQTYTFVAADRLDSGARRTAARHVLIHGLPGTVPQRAMQVR
jgi:hypothetical protein